MNPDFLMETQKRPITACHHLSLSDRPCENETAWILSYESRAAAGRLAKVESVWACAAHLNHVETALRAFSKHVKKHPWSDDQWR